MSETIICTIISAIAAVIGSYLAVQKGRRDDAIKQAQKDQRTSDRLDSIEHKLDIHNGYAEKLGDISQSMIEIRKDVYYLKEKKK